MRRAVFTGSFDPFTKGHLDIVRRAACIFDEVTVAVCVNTEKAGGMFSPEERVAIAEASLAEASLTDATKGAACTIKSEICPGLLADFMQARGITVIIRGARTASEFEYEAAMAEVNRAICGAQTVIFPADPATAFISSTVARDMILYGHEDVAVAEGAIGLIRDIIRSR